MAPPKRLAKRRSRINRLEEICHKLIRAKRLLYRCHSIIKFLLPLFARRSQARMHFLLMTNAL